MLSVGLITYNHEKYIKDAIEGLLAQEAGEVELIILDDASVDNTQVIIQQYLGKLIHKYKRVVNICHNVNTGNVSKNVNEIVDEAKGDFLWLIAADDILLNNALEKMTSVLHDQSECAVVYANMIEIDDDYHFGDMYDQNSKHIENQMAGLQQNMYYRLMHACCVPAPSAVKRMALYRKYGKHDETFFAEDYEYWLRISRTEKFYYLEEPMVLYRRAEASLSNYGSVDGYKKIQRMMCADLDIKKKYLSYLSASEQLEMWRGFYINYRMRCEKIGYDDGKIWLQEQMKEVGIAVDERYKDGGAVIDRLGKENEVLAKWVSLKDKQNFLEDKLKGQRIRTVGIYGYSRLGKLLLSELKKTSIDVKYVIDRKGKMLQLDIPVYTLEDDLEHVDAIIVAPMDLLGDVRDDLKLKLDTLIIEINDLFV